MNKVLDPGHKYELLTLDGDLRQVLTFVKRFDPDHPEKFPGNTSSYPGTTMQSVIRCLIDRVQYLNQQIPHPNNMVALDNLRHCLWLFEDRAAERHGYAFNLLADIEKMPMCPHCGHVVCEKLGNQKPI